MADNIPIVPGVGVTLAIVATDDVGGVQFQKVKLDVGGDGASVPVVGAVPTAPNVTRGAGVNDANTQRVTLASNGPAVTALVSLDAKMPALGQALMVLSQPVVIASNQGAIPVSGTVTVANPSAAGLTNTELRAAVVAVSGTVTVANPSAVGLTNAELRAAVVAVSGTVTVANPNAVGLTNAELRATALPVSGTVTVANPTAAGLTNTELRAVAVPVAPNVTRGAGVNDANTQRVTLASDGPAVTALVSLDTKTPAVGQALMAASRPVVIASNQSAVPVSGTVTVANPTALGLTNAELRAAAVPVSATFFQATQPVSAAALPLPAGAAAEATLAAINTKTPVAGQALMAASTPVVIASNQGAVPVSGTFFQATQPVSIAATVTTTVTANGAVSTANSTTVALAANGVFTGTSEDVTEFADVRVSVFSDQASATDGLSIQQSSNGTNWDVIDTYTIPAGTGKVFSVGASAKFARVVYTNGAVAQATFRLQTKYHKAYSKGSSVRPQDARTNDNDFEEALSHLMGYNGVSWDRLRSTIANGLAVQVTTGDVALQVRATATGAASVQKIQTAATTNAALVKNAPGRVLGWRLTNTSAAARVVRFYNLTVAPTVGTSVPLYTVVIPAGQSVSDHEGFGLAHTVGISLAVTAGLGDLDSTVTAVNDVIGHVVFA